MNSLKYDKDWELNSPLFLAGMEAAAKIVDARNRKWKAAAEQYYSSDFGAWRSSQAKTVEASDTAAKIRSAIRQSVDTISTEDLLASALAALVDEVESFNVSGVYLTESKEALNALKFADSALDKYTKNKNKNA